MKIYKSGVIATYLGGCRIQFTCPDGHRTVRDYGQGPVARRMNEASAQRFAMMWDDRIKAPFVCRKCPPLRPRSPNPFEGTTSGGVVD